MKAKNMLRHFAWGVLGLVSQQAFSQASQANNNGGVGSFLGWNAGANQIVDVKNEGNQPIDFYTTDIFRARINPRVQYPLLNTFPNIPADGFTLITPDIGFLGQAPRGPFSRLHLAEGGTTGNAEQFGYRPWQKNGITFTGNDDQGCLGQKYRDGESGYTDMVMQWSDNPGAVRADRLRFLFTSAYTGATSGMNSREGLEGMRLWPTWENRINVGIGDFYAGNLIDPVNIIDPTERLDVLDGRVRIRQLPNDPEANTMDRYIYGTSPSCRVPQTRICGTYLTWEGGSITPSSPGPGPSTVPHRSGWAHRSWCRGRRYSWGRR
ncbi:MAG: hypothetical protein K1X58_11705 [Flavobacteriales bacterium]|nr:hypothetical protein [Flavobacteriales bacterium]